MAGDDEYEILPREEIETLRKEVERLKKNPFGELEEGESLLESINNLNANIKKLIDIFVKTEADLSEAYANSEGAPAMPTEDLKTIKDQNEQIAQGIVAVADMLKDVKQMEENIEDEKKPITGGPKIGLVRPSREPSLSIPPSPNEGVPSPDNLPELPDINFGDPPPPPAKEAKHKRKNLFSRK